MSICCSSLWPSVTWMACLRYALQAQWEAQWGDSPAAIALTEALGDWTEACVHEVSQAQAWQVLINAVYDLAAARSGSE